MTRRYLVVLLKAFAVWIMFTATTMGAEHTQCIREGAPHDYVVKEGDTLWEIAAKFLHDPGRWTEVWEVNTELENPNLIYPGDHILLIYENGKPRLRRKQSEYTESVHPKTGVVKLRPRIRSYPAQRAIRTIPLHVIGPFLNNAMVVNPLQVENAPRVIALDEDHIVVGAGDYIYVQGLCTDAKDRFYTAFRPGKVFIDPHTRAPLGIEGVVLGKAQLDVPGDPARMQLVQSFAEVKIADRIVATEGENIEPFFMPKYPSGPAQGSILSVFGGLNQIGQYQIIAITGGVDACREKGDVLAIYQTKKDIPSRIVFNDTQQIPFPPLRVGTVIVFRVFEKVSYGLVMYATRPIYLLDEVGRP